ncbi:transcription initiation factor TFIID subunit 3 isoform X2 [Centruroides vittatus]|uniref:transcription initiation factor TFIID subunit 3 isoform X2 n=1 Tax=Centruroides vittatus TaxID=120091 RepID=UPI00350ED3D5
MSSQFAQGILRVAVAQICQNIGWHSVQSSPIDLLVDILQRYLLELSKTAHKYCNQYGRTEPNLDDLGLAFKELGILIQEMEEYANNVEPVAFAHKVSAFPVAHPSNLQSLKVENMESFHGSEWVHENLPESHHDLEDEEGMAMSPSSAGDNGGKKLGLNGIINSTDVESPSLGSPHPGKRSLENSFENPSKKPRLYTEEEGRPMREVTSVFMTSSGLISPACEGRLPDASIPPEMDSPLHTLETRIDALDGISCGNRDRMLKKEKSKKMKDFHAKKESKKKLKPSKKEKENKGNVLLKSEKIVNVIAEIDEVKKTISEDISQKKKLLKCQKNEDDKPLKVKNDKFKQKEEKKNKESTKSIKTKNKLKNSSINKFTSIPKSPKSLKVPKSPSRAKSPVASKTLKPIKSPVSTSLKPLVNTPIKEEPVPLPLSHSFKTEAEEKEKFTPVYDELDESREESPEPRLVIDDSAEAQARQEKECRMAVLDECIDAVIQRAMVESEKSAKENDRAMNETIDEVVRNSTIKKTEPRDIYDFTDSSNSSPPLSPKNPEMGSPIIRNKKEKVKTPDNISTSANEIVKKGKSKDKTKKKPVSKSKVPSTLSSPKTNKTPTPVPIQSPTEKKTPTLTTPERKEIVEIDDDFPVISTSPLKSTPPPQCQLPPPALSPFSSSPFISASPHTVNPFSSYSSPFSTIPAQFPSRVAFPTPPLFVPHRSEISTPFFPAPPSPQPLNLAMSGPNVPVKNSDKKSLQVGKSNKQLDDSIEELNPPKKLKLEDGNEKIKEKKEKEQKKEKKEKVDKKDKSKKKGKEKLKEKAKPKDKIEKGKSDKKNKLKNEKEKKKTKEKEEKQPKDDNSIPKITFKLGGNSATSTKISPPSSSSSPEVENVPDIPVVKTPSPPLQVEQIPASPPAPLTPPPVPAPSISNPKGHPRTAPKGKSSQTAVGKKVTASSSPPARTVIIETLGTFVECSSKIDEGQHMFSVDQLQFGKKAKQDESGNKIWICPACKQPDDGSPMIGCDECDDWYHWVCVGIVVPPKEEESWYCTRCIAKRQGANPRRKKKKHKKEK